MSALRASGIRLPPIAGFPPLAEARALVELYAVKGDRKFERAARTSPGISPSLTDVA
jgi:hypothetical protein